MWDFSYNSVSAIKELLSLHGLSPTKDRGQNFLISDNARKRIADSIVSGLEKGESVWEIGPGLGSITALLLKQPINLTCFELDYGFIEILKEAFRGEENFSLVEGDALSTVFEKARMEGTPSVIAGNLPYNVGSVLIAKLLESQILPKRMVFTLQKEVALRLSSKMNSSDLSSLSTLSLITYDSKILFNLKPADFWPSPKVDSSVVVMTRKQTELYENVKNSWGDFVKINRTLYSKRRKTIKNNLLPVFEGNTSEVLKKLNIAENKRVDEIDLKDIVTLANAYTEFKKGEEGCKND